MSKSQSVLTRLLVPMFVFTCLTVLAHGALPLADKVPGDAVLYIGWAGADGQASAYDGSDLRAFIQASNLRDLIKRYASVQDVVNQLVPAADDDARLVEPMMKILPLLWHHPVAIYAADVTVSSDGTPSGDLQIICDAGPDAAQLQSDLEGFSNGNARLHVSTVGSVVTFGTGKAAGGAVTACLGNDPRFIATMLRLQFSPALAVYVDVKTLLLKADRSAEKDPDGAEVWPKVRDALGITYVKSFAMTAGFDGTRWMTASRLEAPQPRAGLLAAIEPQPIDPVLLARVPASAGSVSVCNLDSAKVYDTLADVMAVRDRSDKVFHQVSGAMTVVLGRNFRKAILGPMGSQWVMFSDSKAPGVMLLNHPTDPDTASDSVVSAAFGIINETNSVIPGASTQPAVTANQQTIKGIDLTSAVTRYASPTFAVKDKVIYFGPSPDLVVTRANAKPALAGMDLVHSQHFIDAVKHLGVSDFSSFSYCDLPATAPTALDTFPNDLKQLGKLLAISNLEMPEIKMPPMDQIKSHLSPSLRVGWGDHEGWSWKSISPFPGSAEILSDPSEVKMLSDMAAILVPAIQKAKVHHAEPTGVRPE